jgi:predicted permease
MNTLLLDFRQSLRSIWKSPGFLIASVLSLALGIGANTAAFSALRTALNPPLAWKSPEELVFVGRQDARFPQLPPSLDVTWATYRLWQEHQTALVSVAGYTGLRATLGGPVEPQSAVVMRVTAEFWPMLGVKPLLGRLPEAQEEGVMVASHKLWASTLQKDPAVVGKPFKVDGRPRILVGVLPPGAVWMGTEVFVPLEPTEAEKSSRSSFLNVAGRAKPGLKEADIQTAFRTLSSQLQAGEPSQKPVTAVPQPLLQRFYGGMMRDRQALLAWVSVFITVLACVNLCTLVLGRSASRLHELGIRQALGAGRAQLFTPLFCDLAAAAIPGLALGWGFTLAAGGLLDAFIPRDFQAFHAPSLGDFAVAMGTALILALAGASLPAFLLPRIRTFGLLGGTRSSGGPGGQWTQKGLVVVQVALAMTLLSSFTLVYRSLQQLKAAPIGITAEHRLLATLSLPVRGAEEDGRRERDVTQVLERIRALPGVEAAGTTGLLPVLGGGHNGNMAIPGQAEPVFRFVRTATDGYFEAAGIPLIEGRTFRSSDLKETADTVIVSQSFARDYFPGQSLIGRSLPVDDLSVTVVGIVGDAQMNSQPGGNNQTVYWPGASDVPRVDLVVKAPGATRALMPELRRILRAQWPDTSLDRVQTLEVALEQGTAGNSTQVALMGLLAALAFVLTVAGIYGVLSRQVDGRRREMGIRLALGGSGSRVTALVVRQGMTVVALGLVAGLGGAVAMGHVLRNQLFQIQPTDPRSLFLAMLLLAVAAFLASLVPALRAARVDPVVALRNE